jgi:hypothetical protein
MAESFRLNNGATTPVVGDAVYAVVKVVLPQI